MEGGGGGDALSQCKVLSVGVGQQDVPLAGGQRVELGGVHHLQ